MRYLADTNILRSAEPGHPTYSETVKATKSVIQRGDSLHVLSQNLIEFWSVATRPAEANGLGMSIPEVIAEINRIKSIFPLLFDVPSIHAEWERLVIAHAVKGKNVHDAHLVAAMNVHGITHLLTFNVADFKRYSEITVMSPAEVVRE